MNDGSEGAARGLLVVFSGPSGVGKTTIVRAVLERLKGVFSISATTRPQGPGEIDRRDYFFVNEDEFRGMLAREELLEHAQVFGRHWYGTPRRAVQDRLDAGELVILDIDVQGALQVKRSMPDAFMLFVLPPSDEELLRRLRSRGREDEASIQRRFAEAKQEIHTALESGAYDAHIVNEHLDEAIENACEAIDSAKRWMI